MARVADRGRPLLAPPAATRPAGAPAARTVTGAGGVRIGCWLAGSGPPLLLVHGTGEDHHRWAPVVAALSGAYTVGAMDRRGRGASGDAEPYRLADEAADIAAAARLTADAATGTQPRRRVAVVAHSYGAICALEAAARSPEIGPLVLFEPPVPTADAPGPASGVADRVRALAEAGDEPGALEVFLRDVVRVPARQVELLRRVPGFRERATAAARSIAREIEATRRYAPDPHRLARVTGPVLLLAGEHSPADIHAGVAAVRAALPLVRPALLAGQSHHAIDTGADGFLDEVRRFLSRAAEEDREEHR